jgi:phage FluMu gp28-like protein
MDATGPGETLAYDTWDKWRNVEPVTLTQTWYREHMGLFVQSFEDGIMDIPRDADHESDLRDLERIDGIVRLPKEASESEEGTPRHGDYAIALALGDYAVRNARPLLTDGFISVPRRQDTSGNAGGDHSSFDRSAY